MELHAQQTHGFAEGVGGRRFLLGTHLEDLHRHTRTHGKRVSWEAHSSRERCWCGEDEGAHQKEVVEKENLSLVRRQLLFLRLVDV